MQEFLSYNEDSKISPQPILSYDQHFGEQPLHFLVEPPETVSSHKLEYYEVCYLQSLMGYTFLLSWIVWADQLIYFSGEAMYLQ